MCKAFYRQLRAASLEQIAAVNVPVLLIAGEGDRVVQPAASSRLAANLGTDVLAPHEALAKCALILLLKALLLTVPGANFTLKCRTGPCTSSCPPTRLTPSHARAAGSREHAT